MTSKFAELAELISSCEYDIIAVSETWFDKNVLESEYSFDSYFSFRQDRQLDFYPAGTFVNEARGGVIIFVKNDLNPDSLNLNFNINAEMVFCVISPEGMDPIIISCVYRPEKGGDHCLQNICEMINSLKYNNVIIVGDFNLPEIDWLTLEGKSAHDRFFIDTIQDNVLSQLVSEATRGRNILDLVLVDHTDLIDEVLVNQSFSNSDHKSLEVTLSTKYARVENLPRKVYLYSKCNYIAMNDELSVIDWESLFVGLSVEEMWTIFKEKYYELVDRYVPCKWIKPGEKQRPAWTRFKSVKKAKETCRKSDIISKKSGLYADKYLAEAANLEYRNVIKSAKADYEDSLVDRLKENPKLFFNYARNFHRTSSTIDKLVDSEGNELKDDRQKADMLNAFFSSVQTKEEPLCGEIPINDPKVSRNIKFKHISPSSVVTKIAKLRLYKACGPDNIHVNVIKNVTAVAVPLSIIFNQSVYMGVIPQDWRDGNINPLHKKGSRKQCNNYRPVTLTSQIVKLLERLLLDQISEHLYKNRVISCEQHGFQSRCSCVTQLLESLNDWTLSYDEKKETDIIYMDFAKAFDSVAHQRLLYKLSHYGINGHIKNWIAAFLKDRRQRVVLRNGVSEWNKVISGVPQGSILGPILFIIFVNDLPSSVVSTAKLFADDTKLYRQIISVSDCDNLQDDLNTLSAWSKLWLLKFNALKCIVLKIRQALNYTYTLNGVELDVVSEQKDLGVLISNDLLPRKHILEITKKANQRVGLIRRCFTNITQRKITTLFITTIRPLLEYASVVWQPHLKKDIDLIQKVQNRCLALCPNPPVLESLENRRKRVDLVETYKIVHHEYNCDPDTFFHIPLRDLRGHQYKLHKVNVNTDVRKYFFTNRVINPWNSLDDSVVTAPSGNSFKKKLRVTPLGQSN